MTAESGAPGLPEKRKSDTCHCKVPQNISCLFPYVGIIQIRFRVSTKQSTLSRLSASSPFSFLFQYFKTFNVMCQEQPRPALRQNSRGLLCARRGQGGRGRFGRGRFFRRQRETAETGDGSLSPNRPRTSAEFFNLSFPDESVPESGQSESH